MANIITTQKLSDATNKALIKITGILDGTGPIAANVAACGIDASSLNGALNATGHVSQTNPIPMHRLSIRKIIADVAMGHGYVQLNWQSRDANVAITTLASGHTDLNFEGTGGLLTNPTANSNGDIFITTTGNPANSAFTIILDIVKEQSHYYTAFPNA